MTADSDHLACTTVQQCQCLEPGPSSRVLPPCRQHDLQHSQIQRNQNEIEKAQQELKKRREAERERKNIGKTKLSLEQLQAKRDADRERKQIAKNKLSPEQQQAKRDADRERRQIAKNKLSQEQQQAKRDADRERKQIAKNKLSQEQQEAKRDADRERKQIAKNKLSPEQQQAKRDAARERQRAARRNTTPEQVQARRKAEQKRRYVRKRKAESTHDCEPESKRNTSIMGDSIDCTPYATRKWKEISHCSDSDVERSSSADSDFSDDDDVIATCGSTLPNHPAAVARAKAHFERRMAGVAAAQCFVCDRIVNTHQVKIFNPADSAWQPPTPGHQPRLPESAKEEDAGPIGAIAAPDVVDVSELVAALVQAHQDQDSTETENKAKQLVSQLIAKRKAEVLELLQSLSDSSDLHDHLIELLAREDHAYVPELAASLLIEPGRYEMCGTCYSNIRRGRRPTMAVRNGFSYPARPAHLPELTDVEEHLLSPRIPFMQITRLGKVGSRGQYGIRGSIISVPVEPGATVRQVIPLLPEEDGVCVVNLKRKLIHKRPYASSYVNRESLRVWGEFLERTPLYMKYGVKFDLSRLEAVPEEVQEDELDNISGQIQHTVYMEEATIPTVPSVSVPSTTASDHAIPQEPPRPDPADPETDVINVAPGEGKEPLSVVKDREAEELAFPSVYLGQPRDFKVRVSRFLAMKSEVRRKDRRGAMPQAVLYKCVVNNREQACNRIKHKFKRGASKHLGHAITKDQLTNPQFVADMQQKGFSMPNIIPNSAQYWEKIGHDVFAMVRQLGKPDLFLTVSAAEYHTPLLLTALKKLSASRGVINGESEEEQPAVFNMPNASVPDNVLNAVDELSNCSEDDEEHLRSHEKLKLIQDDPVVCAMYFREVVKCLRKYMKQKHGVMGEYNLEDYLFRIEFQARGSPHLHALLWLFNAIKDPLKDREATARFIDQLLTCSSKHPMAMRNRHKHTTTCFKSRTVARKFAKKELEPKDAHRYCRFGAPYWPTRCTLILDPLYEERDERPTNDSSTDWKQYVQELKALRLKLKDILVAPDCPDTIDAFLDKAGCDEHTYILAIRSGLTRYCALYNRTMEDIWNNPCLLWVLDIVESNDDAQLVIDVPSLVRYCVGYITKAERTHSELQTQILNMRNAGYDSMAIAFSIASQALRAKETSAQEAAWVLQQFPLSEKSRVCRFIDTSEPDQRIHVPKPEAATADLPGSSTAVFLQDVFDHYANRPEKLKDVSLAVFTARYLYARTDKDTGELVPRSRDWIIRWRKFNRISDNVAERENYYRGLCTLHLPWRSEHDDILVHGEEGSSFERFYHSNLNIIMEGRRRFEANVDLEEELDKAKLTCVADDLRDDDEEGDRNRHFLAGTSKFLFEQAEHMDDAGQDVTLDMPGGDQPRVPSTKVAAVQRRGRWDTETYLQKIRMLNPKQRMTVLTIIDGIRMRTPPRYIFVDGSAGTGKTVIAECVANALETFAPCKDPIVPKGFISAPTGKAADNVHGLTLHSLYGLLWGRQRKASEAKAKKARARTAEEADLCLVQPANPQKLAFLQNRFREAYGHIIDEISMVSQSQLVTVEKRCREAMAKDNELFGGLWTLVLGDFRQLRPVGGTSLTAAPKLSLAGAQPIWQRFEYVELDQNMRQGDDLEYAEILKKIGDYEPLTDYQRKLVESRFITKNKLSPPAGATRLYNRNANVDSYTRTELLQHPQENVLVLMARDRVEYSGQALSSGAVNAASHEKYLDQAKTLGPSENNGLPNSLIAVVGQPYLHTYNTDTEAGLVNGAVGILEWVEFGWLRGRGTEDRQAVVKRLWLRFDNNAGHAHKARHLQELKEAVSRAANFIGHTGHYNMPPPPTPEAMEGLVPIDRRDVILEIPTHSSVNVKRQQFSLVSALALTPWKVQGSTLDVVVMEYMPNQCNEEVYVSMSRVRNLASLFVDDRLVQPNERGHYFQHPPSLAIAEDEKLLSKEKARRLKLLADARVLQAERTRWRSQPMVPRWQHILDFPQQLFRIVYHNVRSLPAHQDDIRLDEVYMNANVVLITETWLRPGVDVQLGGLQLAARCDRDGEGRGGGVAVFTRPPYREVPCSKSSEVEVSVVQLGEALRVAVLYVHNTPTPTASAVLKVVKDALSPAQPGVTTVLCGDFNINMFGQSSSEGKSLIDGMAALGLIMGNDSNEITRYPQTDLQASTIDAVFCNDRRINVNMYQSYFSDHLPLVISLPFLSV